MRGLFIARAWNDFLQIVNLCLVGILVIFMAQMQIKAKKEDEGQPPPGNLVVTVVWPEGDNDVDLWTFGPGEETPVGFSHRDGKVWSLLRDDLGNIADSMPLNMENAYAREVKAGHYVFNLHCYRCHIGLPITAHVEIREANMTGGLSRSLLNTTVILSRHDEEITIVQFDLDDTGAIVPGSVSNVFTPLAKAWKQ